MSATVALDLDRPISAALFAPTLDRTAPGQKQLIVPRLLSRAFTGPNQQFVAPLICTIRA